MFIRLNPCQQTDLPPVAQQSPRTFPIERKLALLSDTPQVFSSSQGTPPWHNGGSLSTSLIPPLQSTASLASIPFLNAVTPRRKRRDQPGVCQVLPGYPNPTFVPSYSPPFSCFVFPTPVLHSALRTCQGGQTEMNYRLCNQRGNMGVSGFRTELVKYRPLLFSFCRPEQAVTTARCSVLQDRAAWILLRGASSISAKWVSHDQEDLSFGPSIPTIAWRRDAISPCPESPLRGMLSSPDTMPGISSASALVVVLLSLPLAPSRGEAQLFINLLQVI